MKNLSMILMGFIIGCLISTLVTLMTNRSSKHRDYLKGYSEGLDYGLGIAAKAISEPDSKWYGITVNSITHDCFAITDTNVLVSHNGGDVFIEYKPSSNILWKGIK